MRKLFTDPKTSDSVPLAKPHELNNQRMQLMGKRGQMKIEWRKILTAQQIAKLLMGDRMSRKGTAKNTADLIAEKNTFRAYCPEAEIFSRPNTA